VADSFCERTLNSARRELENTVLPLARHFDQQSEDLSTVPQAPRGRCRERPERPPAQLQKQYLNTTKYRCNFTGSRNGIPNLNP
jgi:hypothetical protein